MNTVIENILSRRSIRKFNDEPVTKEELLILGECAVHAPSAMCRDTWKFVIINNDKLPGISAHRTGCMNSTFTKNQEFFFSYWFIIKLSD